MELGESREELEFESNWYIGTLVQSFLVTSLVLSLESLVEREFLEFISTMAVANTRIKKVEDEFKSFEIILLWT